MKTRSHSRSRRFSMSTAPTVKARTEAVPRDPNADRLSLRVPVSALTLAGFRDWSTSPEFPEHVRAAFIDQEIFLDMSNEDPELHVMVKTVFCGVLFQLNQAEKKGRLYSDGMLVTNEEANVSN